MKLSNSPYINDTVIHIGYPLTNKDPVCNLDFIDTENLIEKYSVYSIEVAQNMAKVCSRNTNSNYGVGITGKMNSVDKNNPYGELNDSELFEITENIVRTLLSMNSKIIVIACNTATTRCISHLREEFNNVIFVGTEPAIKPACEGNYKNVREDMKSLNKN